ncbi:MAG: hypothetical protein ACLGHU_10720, partial [Alphaproteobacteria bacterium]
MKALLIALIPLALTAGGAHAQDHVHGAPQADPHAGHAWPLRRLIRMPDMTWAPPRTPTPGTPWDLRPAGRRTCPPAP